MLKIKDLSKRYRITKRMGFTALNRVSFEIKDENMIAVIGESGSGKSTLMNLISTIDSPSGGYVEYNNKKVTFNKDKTKAKYRRENIGFVFQSFNLIKDMTVLDNVAIVMEIAGSSKKERYDRAKELLGLVGLADHVNKKPGLLSGGQKQRVAIARALANDPEIILADEPTGALDSTTSLEIMKLLSTIANSGKRVIIVTHDMKVASYCERIIEMKDGNIVADNSNEATEIAKIELPPPLKKSSRGLTFSGVFKLSASAFKRKLRRNILVSVGTAIAITSLLLVNVATQSIENYIEDIQSVYGNQELVKVYSFSPTTGEMLTGSDEFDSKYGIDEIDYIVKREIYDESPLLVNSEISLSNSTMVQPKVMYPDGFDTFGEEDIVSGDIPVDKNDIVISPSLAVELGYNEDSIIGEEITITINVATGVVSEEEILAQIPEEQLNEMSEEEIETLLMEQTTANSATGTLEDDFTVTGTLTDAGIRMFNNTVYFTSEYSKEFSETFAPEETDFTTPIELFLVEDGRATDFVEHIIDKRDITDIEEFTLPQRDLSQVQSIEQTIGFVYISFSFVLGVSVLVAIIMIGVMCYVSILERIREVGILRAVGAKKNDIRKLFFFESISIGTIAGLIAIVLGVGLSFIAIDVVNSQFDTSIIGQDVKVYISPWLLLITFGLSIVLSFASSLLSIGLGLRVSPVDALRKK